jgi:hypothetical protein
MSVIIEVDHVSIAVSGTHGQVLQPTTIPMDLDLTEVSFCSPSGASQTRILVKGHGAIVVDMPFSDFRNYWRAAKGARQVMACPSHN